MDRKLHLLDSFSAQGDDGVTYKVMAYEHLVRNAVFDEGHDLWEATGQLEYRLAGGEIVDMARDGAMRIVRSGVALRKAEAAALAVPALAAKAATAAKAAIAAKAATATKARRTNASH